MRPSGCRWSGSTSNEYSTADSKKLFRESFTFTWRTVRNGTKTARKQIITGPKPDVVALLDQLKGEEDAVLAAALVED